MRTRFTAAACCGFLGLGAAAHAQDVEATRKAALAFGLAGIWSWDCSKPASRENPYLMWEVPASGPVQHRVTFDGRWPAPDFIAAKGALLGDGRLRLSLLTDGKLVMTVTTEKLKGRLHSVEITDGQGKLRMKDGVFLDTGKATGSSELCKDVEGAVP